MPSRHARGSHTLLLTRSDRLDVLATPPASASASSWTDSSICRPPPPPVPLRRPGFKGSRYPKHTMPPLNGKGTATATQHSRHDRICHENHGRPSRTLVIESDSDCCQPGASNAGPKPLNSRWMQRNLPRHSRRGTTTGTMTCGGRAWVTYLRGGAVEGHEGALQGGPPVQELLQLRVHPPLQGGHLPQHPRHLPQVVQPPDACGGGARRTHHPLPHPGTPSDASVGTLPSAVQSQRFCLEASHDCLPQSGAEHSAG